MDNDLLNLTGMWAHEKQPELYSAKMQQGTLWLRPNKEAGDQLGLTNDKPPDFWLSFQSGADKTFVNLAGMYVNKSQNGNEYLAGNFGGLRVMIFYKDKKTDKHPDISVCITQKKDNKGQSNGTNQTN